MLDLVCIEAEQIFLSPSPVVIFLAQRVEASEDLVHIDHLFYLTTDLVGEQQLVAAIHAAHDTVATTTPVEVFAPDAVVFEFPIEVVSLPLSFLEPSMAGVVCDRCQMVDLLCDSQICILVVITFELAQVVQEV